jgi:integral membrane protein
MAASYPNSTLRGSTAAFRVVAYVEAATYLVLLGAVVLYRVFDGPDFISLLGPIHGIAFLVYLFLVLAIREGQGWGFWRTVVVILAAAVPLGGFWAGRHLADEHATTHGR